MTFIQPFLLILGILIGVPFIIHLMGERKYQPMPFSTLKFFREIEKESLQRLHIRQWLILISRALWITMLVLVLAQPFLNTSGGQADPGVIIIDKTFSTQSDPDFVKAEEQLRSEFGNWPFIAYDENTDTDSLKSDIQEIISDRRLGQANILLMSDLQDNATNAEIVNMLNGLSERLLIVNKAKTGRNSSVSGLKSSDPGQNGVIGIQIEVSGNALADKEESIAVSVNGKHAGQTQSNERGIANFYFGTPDEKMISCVVSCRDDDYPSDNKRYLSIRHHSRIRILCISKPSEAYYHINALKAMENTDIHIIEPDQLPAADLSEFDMIWFSDLYDINGNMKKALLNYANEKPLLITSGIDPENAALWQDVCGKLTPVERQGYTPLKIKEGEYDESEFRINKYYHSDLDAEDVFWETAHGDPVLIKADEHRFILLSPFHFSWNEMGLSPYFTRVLEHMLNKMLMVQGLSYKTGDTIPLSGSFATITTPTGEKYRERDRFDQTQTPGFYTIETENEIRIIAVNIPQEECIQTVMKPDNVKIIYLSSQDISDINQEINGRNAQTLFLIFAMFFIIFEMLLLGKGERIK